jgi:predicted permease
MKLLQKLRALFRKEKLDRDMAEEMRFHLNERAAENIDDGMPPDEAHYAAQRKFGGVEQIKEHCRDQRGWRWLEQFVQDIRYAFRGLARQRGFTIVAVLTLALGIGATTSIFSVVNAIILKPLPYDQPGQVVQIFESPKPGAQNPVSPGSFLDWRSHATLFESFTAYQIFNLNLTGVGDPVRISGLRMSANGLQLLRARPLLGRLFAPDEDQPGKEKVIVLTHQLWQRQFAGADDVIGRTIALNGENFTVIGVLPAGFLPFENQLFVVPFVFQPSWAENRGGHFLRVFARVKSGVAIEQARAELAAITARLKALRPDWKKDWTTTVIPLGDQLVREIKPALLLLLAAVGVVLVIACTNVANLLLAKAAGRAREIALRAALGASRGRIVRQLLAESVVLSMLGGGLGLAFAVWSIDGLRHILGAMNFARAHEIALDGPVLVGAFGVSVLTGIGFGLVPALHASRPELTDALKDAAHGSRGRGEYVRSGLIVGEVALSLVLLIGAGLLLNTFVRILNVSTGFIPENALTLQLSLADTKYPDHARRLAFYDRVAERVAALPGVDAAGLAGTLPFSGGTSNQFVRIPGWSGDRAPGFDADYDFCTMDYLRAMGVPLRQGRFFHRDDGLPDRRTAIINETMARTCFPNENPLGRQLVYGNDALEIVGVVGDVRMHGLTRPVRPMVYRVQSSDPWRFVTLVIRTAGEPLAIAESVRKTILEIDPDQPVANVRSLAEVVMRSVGDRRLTATLFALFAVAALSLAAIGLYGVIAYAVGQRTREFGIRVALGATKRDVLRLVLRRGMILTGIGLACGLAVSFGLTRVLGKFLYEIKPTDPLTFVCVSLLLLVVALFATWLPARRAAKVNPMVALRAE